MFKIIFLTLVSFHLFALDISIESAKESNQPYSVLNIKNSEKFLCQEIKDDFDGVSKIVCAFAKEPKQKISKINSAFFEIETQKKDKTFFLIIKPLKKIKLYPKIFDFKKDESIFDAPIELSYGWMVVAFIDTPPFIKEQPKNNTSINFPFVLNKDRLPYVGSLDFKGNPVHISKVADVTEYLKSMQNFEDKKYDIVVSQVDDVIKDYPNSLFMAELLYYKIKSLDKLGRYDEVSTIASAYLKEFSADENVAEIISLLAKAYGKMGYSTDADYFFDRLFNEHSESIYSKWGLLYLAEHMESLGSTPKAKELYKRAINESGNVDIAIEAAFKLVKIDLESLNTKAALEYIQKISNVKPEFFLQHYSASYDMMHTLSENGEFYGAMLIAKALLDGGNKTPNYEEILKNYAIWLGRGSDKKSSLEYLNRYLDEFKDGLFVNEIKIAKDALFFDVEESDENLSEKLTKLDSLIEEYGSEELASKALYEKAKLLNANKRYADVLNLEYELEKLNKDEYKDVDTIIKESAIGSMKELLDKKECSRVLAISSKYKIELSREWDEGLYECATKGNDYVLAKKITTKNLNSKNIQERKKWLFRHIVADFGLKEYAKVVYEAQELLELAKDDKNYQEIYRYLFDTYKNQSNYIKMVETLDKVVSNFGTNYKDLDRYMAMLNSANAKKDINLVVEYGEKILDINKKIFAPQVEFALYDAYMQKNEPKKAFEMMKLLDGFELSSIDRSRQKYLLGNALLRLWRNDEALRAYDESIEAKSDSAWANLAKKAKELN